MKNRSTMSTLVRKANNFVSRKTTKPTMVYHVEVTLDLYDSSPICKFGSFAKRICGTNIQLRETPEYSNEAAYFFETTQSGFDTLVNLWNKRLGIGADSINFTVTNNM